MRVQPYERLKFYQDICEIRLLTGKLTKRFEKSHFRLVSQMRDAARSAKQNIREGYRRGSLNIFINSIKISKGSLEELSGDMEDCLVDGLISKEEFATFYEFYQSASFMSSRYIVAMGKSASQAKWKSPDRKL